MQKGSRKACVARRVPRGPYGPGLVQLPKPGGLNTPLRMHWFYVATG